LKLLMIMEEKWPVLARHERAAEWLRVWADPGRAARTIDAYARGLAEFLEVCEGAGVDPVRASRADVAVFVRTTITSGGNRNPVNTDFGGDQERERIDNFTGQACLDLADAQRNGARSSRSRCP
jgi:hypothetical protein